MGDLIPACEKSALPRMRLALSGLSCAPALRKWGIRVRRDNWVSVRYAEGLNSGKSSVLLQRADRHGILGEKPPSFQVSL
jgi:hypothetical protein